MRSPAIVRIAISLILIAWGSPTAASFAVGLHLAAQHHHDERAAAVALAMAHGHEHDLKVPAHRHDAPAPDSDTFRAPSASSELIRSSLVPAGGAVYFAPLAADRAHSPPSAPTLSPLRL